MQPVGPQRPLGPILPEAPEIRNIHENSEDLNIKDLFFERNVE